MIDRRNFIKKTVVAGIAVGISNPLLSSEMNTINSNIVKPNQAGFAWNKTIFCQFENQEIEKEIERFAQDINCKVYYGEPNSPDIIATPYFVSILDRNIIGKKCWKEYMDYCNEVDDNAPCIIVDKNDFHDEFEWPNNKCFAQYYLSECKNEAINALLKMVKKIKKEIDSHKEIT